MDIEEMLEKGTHPATIAAVLDIPVVIVYDVLASLEGQTEELSPFETINS
jgi:hypothetical protein